MSESTISTNTYNNHSSNFDATQDGRGIWFIFQIKAILATTPELKKQFVDEMIFLSIHYPCEKCRNHIKKFLKDNPIELYLNVSRGDRDIGMFKWIWSLHNSVNIRLGKPIMDFDTAFNLFDPNNIIPCNTGCAEESGESNKLEEYNKLGNINPMSNIFSKSLNSSDSSDSSDSSETSDVILKYTDYLQKNNNYNNNPINIQFKENTYEKNKIQTVGNNKNKTIKFIPTKSIRN